jgi:methyltransferase-like protein
MTGETPGEKENQEQEKPIAVEESMIPIKNQEVTIREEIEEDGKYILFNAENELILVINPTGKFILENCNGERTVGDIIKNIRENFTIKEDMDLTSIVKEYFSTLLLAKLVKIKIGELG